MRRMHKTPLFTLGLAALTPSCVVVSEKPADSAPPVATAPTAAPVVAAEPTTTPSVAATPKPVAAPSANTPTAASATP
jgi:hypothetical protein